MMEEIMNKKQSSLFNAIDKLRWWNQGEWIEEADLLEFTYKSMNCLIKRIATQEPYCQEENIFGGHLCGYVQIPKNHFCFGKHYDLIEIDVHGGLTFSEFVEDKYWIGFDCGHLGDLIPSNEKNKKEHLSDKSFAILKELENSSIFFSTYKNINFCIDECKSMVDQLIEIDKK